MALYVQSVTGSIEETNTPKSCRRCARQTSNPVEDEQWIGAGLICVEARYRSRLLLGGGRIERLHPSAMGWREIDAEIGLGLSAGPLPASSVIARSLLGDSTSALARYLHQQPVSGEPKQIAAALDALLRGIGITGVEDNRRTDKQI